MKRFFLLALMLAVCPLWADTAVQTDQNQGPLDLASPTVTVGPTVPHAFFFGDEFPASTTQLAWESTNGVLLSRLPKETRGIQITAFGGDLLLGGADITTSAVAWVGVKIGSGTSLIWSGRNPTAGIGKFRILAFGAASLTAAIVAW